MFKPFLKPAHYGDHTLVRPGAVAALKAQAELMARVAFTDSHQAVRNFCEMTQLATVAALRAAGIS